MAWACLTAVLAPVLASATLSSSRRTTDEVRNLPGLRQPLCFKHYAGYLPTAIPGKRLFYWYVEATQSPADKPVLLWLNGGPGCSSLGGMWTENGPFVAGQHGKVTLNPCSWNQVANVLYLEQPAGVGFSYPSLDTNDTVTTADTYAALLAFLQDYNLLGHRFFIVGESYGGHFVPNTVEAILRGNAASRTTVNLVGFAVGNGYTDWEHDFNANVPYARYHALCSPQDFDAVKQACGEDTARCFWRRPDIACPAACGAAVEKAVSNAMDTSIDIYDIYADVCPKPSQSRVSSQAFVMERYRRKGLSPVSPIFPTCADSMTEAYLSRRDVQEAIHARYTDHWRQCDLGNNAKYDFNYASVLPAYREWTSRGDLRMLIYSGDTDFIVNFLGTQSWVESLRLPRLRPFRRWRGSDGQVAGYVTDYPGLTHATVKGAGHMVPTDRPRHALDMISAFLNGTALDRIPEMPGAAVLCTKGTEEYQTVYM